MKRPLLLSSVCVSSVAVISVKCRPIAVPLVISAVVLLGFLIYKKSQYKIIIACAAVTLVLLSYLNCMKKLDKISNVRNASVCVTVIDEPYYSGGRIVIPAKTSGGSDLPEGIEILLYGDDGISAAMGDRMAVDIKLLKLGNSEDTVRYMSDGVYAKAKITASPEIKGRSGVMRVVGKIRFAVKERLSSGLSQSSAATLIAILLGDKSGLTDEFTADIRSTGVSHVMAVSGMHLSIIMGNLFKIIDRIFYNKYARALLSLAAVVFIAAVCGFTKSVVRAAVMYMISAAAPIFGKRADAMNSLAGAVVLIVIVSPFAIFNIGFALSVAATLGVIAAGGFISWLPKPGIPASGIISGFAGMLATSVSAAVFTFPIVLLCFRSVSLVSLAANIAITCAVTGALIFSIAAVLIAPFSASGLTGGIFSCCGYCAEYINSVIKELASLPYASVSIADGIAAYILAMLGVALIAAILIFMYACKKRIIMIELEKQLSCDDRR